MSVQSFILSPRVPHSHTPKWLQPPRGLEPSTRSLTLPSNEELNGPAFLDLPRLELDQHLGMTKLGSFPVEDMDFSQLGNRSP